ncbi:hypothetical protein [Bartonella sp. AP65SXKL]
MVLWGKALGVGDLWGDWGCAGCRISGGVMWGGVEGYRCSC